MRFMEFARPGKDFAGILRQKDAPMVRSDECLKTLGQIIAASVF